MTTLQNMSEQSLTPDSLVPIMLKYVDGWGQNAIFVALTMRCKIKIAWEWQRRPTAATTQHPMPDLITPPSLCLLLTIQQWKKKIEAGLLQRHIAATNT